MCENFRNQFIDKVMTKIGNDTFVLDCLKNHYDIEAHPCRNINSRHHQKCKKYQVQSQKFKYGDSCNKCNRHFCDVCTPSSFFVRPNGYMTDRMCFECYVKKDFFLAKSSHCLICLNNNPNTFIYEVEHNAFFCFNCRNKTSICSLSVHKDFRNTLCLVESTLPSDSPTQSTATPILSSFTTITQVPKNGAVVLHEPILHHKITISNQSDNALTIFPSIGTSVNLQALNEPLFLQPLSTITLIGETLNLWKTVPY